MHRCSHIKPSHTSWQVSALSYGAWVTFGNQLDVDQATEVMKAAWDAGVNLYDGG